MWLADGCLGVWLDSNHLEHVWLFWRGAALVPGSYTCGGPFGVCDAFAIWLTFSKCACTCSIIFSFIGFPADALDG